MMKAFLGKIENVFSGSRFDERATKEDTPDESKKFTFMDYEIDFSIRKRGSKSRWYYCHVLPYELSSSVPHVSKGNGAIKCELFCSTEETSIMIMLLHAVLIMIISV